MIDTLPNYPKSRESAIINLERSSDKGSHWVCYVKNKNVVHYFDSFGNLKPPPELLKYFQGIKVLYNRQRYQAWNTEICGQLCLKYLLDVSSHI